MEIKVKGKASTDIKIELKSAAKFFGRSILSSRSFSDLYVEIHIKQKLDARGYCEILEEGRSLPNSFIIELEYVDRKEMLSTLAHEMVHVKQYRTGEMKNTRHCDFTNWKGKKINVITIPYEEHPWEIEAHNKEVELLERYFFHLVT